MDEHQPGVESLWDDIDWAIGQLLMVGWDGTEVTPQIRSLIQDYHVGSIILAPKNLQSAAHATQLVRELQAIAHEAGHPLPLLIGIDQENGGVNSLLDESCVCQFPSAMGVAATGDIGLARDVSAASAAQIAAVGCNLVFGPVLDALANSNSRSQPLGVRAASDDPREVSAYGLAVMEGANEAGVACCGKHFPSYGNLDFGGGVAGLGMPVITQTVEELSLTQLVPFRDAVAAGLDAMMVGGCAISNHNMSAMHACLSEEIATDLLRTELGFDGVAISECLEMETVRDEMGVQNGVLMAVEAGCDNVMLCRAFDTQIEALSGLRLAVENGVLPMERIHQSIRRLNRLKHKTTSWDRALNPPGVAQLAALHSANAALAASAYDRSVVVVRDTQNLIPLSSSMGATEELLLLTPLVKRLPTSSHTTPLATTHHVAGGAADGERGGSSAIMSGEDVFRELGRALARARGGKLLHTSYTASGVRPVHENLVERASCIVVVTADAQRNVYQAGFVKHIQMLAAALGGGGGGGGGDGGVKPKQLMVVAVSSPYDFATDRSVGTYICSFDFSDAAIASLVRALFGEFRPTGSLPGTLRRKERPSRTARLWLAEAYNVDRDGAALSSLFGSFFAEASMGGGAPINTPSSPSMTITSDIVQLPTGTHNMTASHFVVRNSTTGAILGFVATYTAGNTGMIGGFVVCASKRNTGIGRALYTRAMRVLLEQSHVTQLQLGVLSGMAAVSDGKGEGSPSKTLSWFGTIGGWDVSAPRRMLRMGLSGLRGWSTPEGLPQAIQAAGIGFELVRDDSGGVGGFNNDSSEVLTFIGPRASPDYAETYAVALRESSTGTCGIVRACFGGGSSGSGSGRSSPGGDILGTIIVCGANSVLCKMLTTSSESPPPALGISGAISRRDKAGETGGMICPVVAENMPGGEEMRSLVLQGLVLMGIRQNRGYGARSVVLCSIEETSRNMFEDMGFSVLLPFDRVINPIERFQGMF